MPRRRRSFGGGVSAFCYNRQAAGRRRASPQPPERRGEGTHLRHTFATLALQNGVDVKTVSSMLGHYDAGFTLRTYTHATRQMQQKAAEKMGSFMAQIR